MSNVTLLAGFTARARAYVQAISDAGLKIDRVIAFGDISQDAVGAYPNTRVPIGNDIFTPDLGEPLSETCAKNNWPIRHITADNVNEPSVREVLEQASPHLIIYAGYGGQIVGRDVLELGFPVLHMHAGWLPDFRGSTTIYYSWLEENRCGISAILLDLEIDTGPILLRRNFQVPPNGVDVDFEYDNALRANVLVEVLSIYRDTGSLPNRVTQKKSLGRTYYVIHPVLKHLALLEHEGGTS